jgi:hypothetical protein
VDRRRWLATLLLASIASLAASCQPARDEPWPAPIDDRTFRAMTQGFSEPDGTYAPKGGYRSDNLVSNERSLQSVLPALRERRRAGAYLGVGPEQNFTYVVALEPSIAFVVDIRRENQLLHFMYKALAEESRDRADFLSRLFGRSRPPGLDRDAPVDVLFDALERQPRSAPLAQETFSALVARLKETHGFPLSADDVAGLSALYQKFGEGGPRMGWDTGGSWIPSYAELMAETDPDGVGRSYLASEEAYAVFRRYQVRNRIVPIVGDFGGETAMRSIGRYLQEQSMVVAVFYTSNVESYLPGRAYDQYVRNVASLPADEGSTVVRTLMHQIGATEGRPDFRTTVLHQPMRSYLAQRAPVPPLP